MVSLAAQAAALLALVALGSCSVAQGRSLLQAANCPAGCLACVADPFALNQVRCTACDDKRNSIIATDGTCGCRRGQYLKDAPSGTTVVGGQVCTLCPVGSYCSGGTATSSATSTSCGTGLTTRNTGAGKVTACVTLPGYSYIPGTASTPPSAAECPQHRFNVGYNTFKECTPCKAGLRTADFGDTTTGKKSTSNSACQVPSGWYSTSNGKPLRCAKGQYRNGLAAVGTGTAKCNRCGVGTTTNTTESRAESYCKVLLPGYKWQTTPTGRRLQQAGTPTPSNTYTAILCPYKSYCTGDISGSNFFDNKQSGESACTNGLWTKGPGAKTADECQVPPGHKWTGTAVTKCSTSAGEYRSGWVTPAAGVTSVDCLKCGGSGSNLIKSDDTETVTTYAVGETDPTKMTFMGAPVTSYSCYIEQGEGIMYDNTTAATFRKVTCNNGKQYGVAGKKNGLDLTPCQDCAPGMFTQNSAIATGDEPYKNTDTGGFYDPKACKTLAGYGYDGNSATACGKGTWNDGKDDPADVCKPCPDGTTTVDFSSSTPLPGKKLQDCKILLPGWGQAATTATSADDVNTEVLTPANKKLAQCEVGSYRSGEIAFTNTGRACVSCGTFTTREAGATKSTDCDICPLGTGTSVEGTTKPSGWDTTKSACTACPSGYYAPERQAGDFACKACPSSSTNVFNFVFNADQNTFTPAPMTIVDGASAVSQCVLNYAAITDGNWYLEADVAGLTAKADKNTFSGCVDACSADDNCEFLTFVYSGATGTNGACYVKSLASETAATTSRLAYKVLPSANVESSSRGAKPSATGTGQWSWWAEDGSLFVQGEYASADQPPPTATVNDCLTKCNDDPECAGVKFTVPNGVATTAFAGTTTNTECKLFSGKVMSLGTTRSMIKTRRTYLAGVKPSGV